MKVTGFRLFPVPPRWLFLGDRHRRRAHRLGRAGHRRSRAHRRDRRRGAVRAGRSARTRARSTICGRRSTAAASIAAAPILMSASRASTRRCGTSRARSWATGLRAARRALPRQDADVHLGRRRRSGRRVRADRDAARAQGWTTFKLNGRAAEADRQRARRRCRSSSASSLIRERFGNAHRLRRSISTGASRCPWQACSQGARAARPLFVEEPVLPEHWEHYARLAARPRIPLAAGERMFSRFDFKRVLERGGLSDHPAGSLARRRHHRVRQDRRHGRGLRRRPRAALPARPHGAGRLPAGRLRRAQRRAARAIRRHPLQPRRRAARLRPQQGRLPHRARLIAPLPGPGLGVDVDEEAVVEASKRAGTGATRCGATTTAQSRSGESTPKAASQCCVQADGVDW